MKKTKHSMTIILLLVFLFSFGSNVHALEDSPSPNHSSPSIIGSQSLEESPSPIPTLSSNSTSIVTTTSTAAPTTAPTADPPYAPTATPALTPSLVPTTTPTVSPSLAPTPSPTLTPSLVPMTTPTPTSSPTPTLSPSPTLSLPTGLEIDTENIYKGMDKAYKSGYLPTIENGVVSIVLPLIPTDEIYGNEIVVSPDFSGTASTFVISNYQKTVCLTEEKINNTEETKAIYYVTFDLPLSPARSNGTYPLIIKVKAYDKLGVPLEKQFTIYINITDIPTTTPVPQNNSISTPTAEPVILIKDCIITPDKVFAGEEFTVKLTLQNSLNTKAIKNLLVSIDTGNLQINLNENGNVLKLDNIKANGSIDLDLNFSSDQSIPAGKYIISLNFTYDTWQTLRLSSTGTLVVDIHQPANMELVMPRIPEKTNSGETLPLSFQIMNMGRDSIFNVRCEVSGIGLISYNTGYIGTMTAGSSSETTVNLYVGTLTMSEDYTGENMYGPTSGIVKLIYEDTSGEEYYEEFPFETSIGTPIIESSSTITELEEKEETASQWWISVLIILVIIIGFVSILLLSPRKRGLHEKTHR